MTIEPAVSTNAGPLAPQSTTGIDVGEALVDTIAAEYVHRLRLAHSPLIATDELSFERADYARAVVHSVLTALSNPAGTAPTLDTRPVVVELADSGIGPSVALAGAALLFETALRRLDHALPHQNVDIAICLARHLLFGIARVLDSAGIAVQRQDLVTEIVDSSLLRATLSRREADIFMLLVDKAKTSDIAVRLGIEKITVKHHISNIGRKLGGRGRAEVLRRARELGILVAAPLTAGATITALNALTGN